MILNGAWVALHASLSQVGQKEFWYFSLFSLLWHVTLLAVLWNSFKFWGIMSLKELLSSGEKTRYFGIQRRNWCDKTQKIRHFMVLGIFFWSVEFTDMFMSKTIACGLFRKVLLQNSWALQNISNLCILYSS